MFLQSSLQQLDCGKFQRVNVYLRRMVKRDSLMGQTAWSGKCKYAAASRGAGAAATKVENRPDASKATLSLTMVNI